MDRSAQKRKDREQKKRDQQKRQARREAELRANPRGLQFSVNADWKETGMARLSARRDALAGRIDIAYFRIFLDIEGLSHVDFLENVGNAEWLQSLEANKSDAPIAPISEAEAKALIAGALRFTTTYGLRLPNHTDKVLAIIGGVGAWRDADTSLFKASFKGSQSDLVKRLERGRPTEFLARTDIDFSEMVNSPSSQAAAEENDRVVSEMTDAKIRDIELALTALDEPPLPGLRTAVELDFIVLASLLKDMGINSENVDSDDEMDDMPEMTADELAQRRIELRDLALTKCPPDLIDSVRQAIAQMLRAEEWQTAQSKAEPPKE